MTFKKILYSLVLTLTFCFTSLTQGSPDWFKPFPPFRIAGNLYYVGSEGLASYLIVTNQGNILINSDYDVNVPMIKKNIEQLGFKFSDTKILLISQSHSDHAAGSALIKAKTGASYMVMEGDASVVESGGKTDFSYGNDPSQFYKVTKVDRVLHDGEAVTLGNTTLIAHLTAGHSKGCTTWTMQLPDHGKIMNVVIVGGVALNPGTKLMHNAAYPNILQDYTHTWQVLKSLPCDIFLGAHGVYFDLQKKYTLLKAGVKNPFIDPTGYKTFILQKEHEFQLALAKQKSQP